MDSLTWYLKIFGMSNATSETHNTDAEFDFRAQKAQKTESISVTSQIWKWYDFWGGINYVVSLFILPIVTIYLLKKIKKTQQNHITLVWHTPLVIVPIWGVLPCIKETEDILEVEYGS